VTVRAMHSEMTNKLECFLNLMHGHELRNDDEDTRIHFLLLRKWKYFLCDE
jgi:hypothetical protein